jgi:hypothetical protein
LPRPVSDDPRKTPQRLLFKLTVCRLRAADAAAARLVHFAAGFQFHLLDVGVGQDLFERESD